MRISECQAYRYRLPLAEPLALSGRFLRERAGVLVRIDSDGGSSGWGDVAPLPTFSRESIEGAAAEVAVLANRLRGAELDSPRNDLESWLGLVPATEASPSVRFGLETALASLSAAVERGLATQLAFFDGAVPISGLLAGSRKETIKHARRFRDSGLRAVKLKVGFRPVPQDVELARTVRAVLGDEVGLRLDANRRWTLEQAVEFGRGVGAKCVEYLEEPLREPSDLGKFFDATGIPVALDESLLELRPDDLEGHPEVGAVVLKPTLLGGIGRARTWIAKALEMNVRPVVSGCFESGVGLLALAELAWSCTGDRVPAGLDTYRWLDADVVQPRIPVHSGAIRWRVDLAGNHCIDTGRLHAIRHD